VAGVGGKFGGGGRISIGVGVLSLGGLGWVGFLAVLWFAGFWVGFSCGFIGFFGLVFSPFCRRCGGWFPVKVGWVVGKEGWGKGVGCTGLALLLGGGGFREGGRGRVGRGGGGCCYGGRYGVWWGLG